MKVRRSISIDPQTFNFVMDQAKKEGRNFSNMLEAIVRRYMRSLKKDKGNVPT
ncbi:unnamed protein product [marine sediment metagenome]|uniref:Ribbon-helix-helix protein CopG domain-containing protein n=1 Tax=marine sediment metagenome TaxID=412755 RepID=X1JJ88_9ZZZZ